MIFDDTRELLRKTEEIFLKNGNGNNRFMNYIDKKLNHNTLGFIHAGCDHWLIFKTVIVTIFIWLLLTLKINHAEYHFMFNFLGASVLAIIFAPLSIPSRALDNDVKSETIKQVCKEIIKKGLSPLKLQAIKDNLVIMKTAFESKVRIAKWVITALWAILVFFYTQYCIPFNNSGKTIKIVLEATTLILIFMFIIGLFYLAVKSFHRTGKRIFLTLSFAMNEIISEEQNDQ